MSSDQNFKDVATATFTSWGYKVTQIPELSDSRTPDLLLELDDERIVVELKSREDDKERLAEEAQRLDAGELVERAETIYRTNSLSGIVQGGVAQLDAYADSEDLRLIWIHVLGEDQDIKERQIQGTLYGISHVTDMESSGPVLPCYYFTNSEFHRYRNSLDGVIVSSGEQAQLLLNDYSPRADNLRSSRFISTFGTAVIDPPAIEEKGEAYVADCTIDRQAQSEVILFLQDKYDRRRLLHIPMASRSARMSSNVSELTLCEHLEDVE